MRTYNLPACSALSLRAIVGRGSLNNYGNNRVMIPSKILSAGTYLLCLLFLSACVPWARKPLDMNDIPQVTAPVTLEDKQAYRQRADELRSEADKQFAAANEALENAQRVCWDKFFVSYCLNQAHEQQVQARVEKNRLYLQAGLLERALKQQEAIEERAQAKIDKQVQAESRASRAQEAQQTAQERQLELEDKVKQHKLQLKDGERTALRYWQEQEHKAKTRAQKLQKKLEKKKEREQRRLQEESDADQADMQQP
jgi:hypothetical protein